MPATTAAFFFAVTAAFDAMPQMLAKFSLKFIVMAPFFFLHYTMMGAQFQTILRPIL